MKIHYREFPVRKVYAEAVSRVGHDAKTYGDIVAAFVPREVIPVESDAAAVDAIRAAFLDAVASSEVGPLTVGERMMLVGDILQSNAKYLIRIERHGNDQKEGGLE